MPERKRQSTPKRKVQRKAPVRNSPSRTSNRPPNRASKKSTPRRNKTKKPKIKYVKDVEVRRIPFIVYILAFLGFLLGVVTLISGANVTIQRTYNSALEGDLISIVNLNNNLNTILSGELDIGYIEYLARTNLNMIDPAPHQIRHIEIQERITPVVDFTQPPLYEESFVEGITGFLNRFWNFIAGN